MPYSERVIVHIAQPQIDLRRMDAEMRGRNHNGRGIVDVTLYARHGMYYADQLSSVPDAPALFV